MWSLHSTENREERDRNPSAPQNWRGSSVEQSTALKPQVSRVQVPLSPQKYMVVVVRNGSELDCESGVRNSLAGSNPVFHPVIDFVTQQVEYKTFNFGVVGSIPTGITK